MELVMEQEAPAGELCLTPEAAEQFSVGWDAGKGVGMM